jgi:hypothetical protein
MRGAFSQLKIFILDGIEKKEKTIKIFILDRSGE